MQSGVARHRTIQWSMRTKRRQSSVALEEEEKEGEASMSMSHCSTSSFSFDDVVVDENEEKVE